MINMFATQYCVTPTKRPGMRLPDRAATFLRDVRRRSLRVKRSKSLVINPPEKRKSDSFVNSQEWTLSRGVPDIRLGIVGSLSSGKSALVHRYLTGSYMQEESPEGGRFKKEVVVDGHSYLLLIRDEGGPPELQFTSWVDAVIFVFSLENEASFNAIYNYYVKMSQFRNMQEIPLILVGTQDAISENQPRVIDDARARKLASDLKRCSYYETCATYGLNVERVFQDACQKLTQNRPINSRPSTPNHYTPRTPYPATPGNYSVTATSPSTNNGYPGGAPPSPGFHTPATQYDRNASYHKENRPPGAPLHMMTPGTNNTYHYPMYHDDGSFAASAKTATGRGIMVPPPMPPPSSSIPPSHRIGSNNTGTLSSTGSAGSANEISATNSVPKFAIPHNTNDHQPNAGGMTNKENSSGSKELPTPSSTPTSSRKNRRRSNLFTPSKKNQTSDADSKDHNGVHGTGSGISSSASAQCPQLGSGRSIPIRQGLLYKKSNKSFSKDWKKKYATLCDDGRMTYYPNLNDYMSNVHGKDIPLQYVTVKVPGQKPRGSRTVQSQPTNIQPHASESNFGSVNSTTVSTSSSTSNIMGGAVTTGSKGEKVLLTSYEMLSGDNIVENNNDIEKVNVNNAQEKTTPNVKKRHHRRIKSNGVKSSASSFLQSSSTHENVNGGSADDSGGSCGGLAANSTATNSESNTFEFHIVSLDNKQWHFEASSCDERDEWVSAIEQQILNTLQGNESSKAKGGHNASSVDIQKMKSIKSDIAGNNKCVDCDAPNPDWASINIGVLFCIECSGVHRNLGSHISRVRSLDLDEWPPGHLAVMTALGNRAANSIWEGRIPHPGIKPSPNSNQEEKERFIIAKYSRREFLIPIPNQSGNMNNAACLVDAICRSDMKSVALVLAHCNSDDVNSSVSPRDARSPLHLASSLGNLALVQLLIWSNGNVKAIDHDGRTCVSYARTSGVTELVELLLSNGCPDITLSGTLPRRKNSLSSHRKNDVLDKVTSSVL